MAQTVPILLPLGLDIPYDYLLPEGMTLSPGDIVRVPLGARMRHGVVWDRQGPPPELDPKKLKPVESRLALPPLPAVSRRFTDWVADYTLASRGMVLRMVLAGAGLGEGRRAIQGVRATGRPPPRRTAERARVLTLLEGGKIWERAALAAAADVSPSVIAGLIKAGVLETAPLPQAAFPPPQPDHGALALSPEQAEAAETLVSAVTTGGFSPLLLDGVTGSGKTEVYFEALAACFAQGKQALVLLPEIALTDHFLKRFERRFGVAPAPWHSAMGEGKRKRVWHAVARGEALAVIGARSALFLPFPKLGVIVVDEEHDPAYKQEDRVPYHGRDMAVVRAHLGDIPIVLSSATPSLETWVNAERGRYRHVRLKTRHAGARLPDLATIDLRAHPPPRGRWLSPPLVSAITETLGAGHQVLLFLNRRGYAPLTLCRRCGFRFECPHCAAWLVRHQRQGRLQCHQCGYSQPVPKSCPQCGAEDSLVPCGPGVERVAEEAAHLFPDARQAILSSDVISGVMEMRETLNRIASGQVDIIVGTQLIAKGHHFPGLALVGVVDGDLGLAQGDPRAGERCFQLLHQVTGRAGREGVAGHGLIQTHMPDHPVMEAIVSGDRDRFLACEKQMREQAGLPPFGRLVALLVTSRHEAQARAHAQALRAAAPPSQRLRVLGPVAAPIPMIRGRHRIRLLVKADARLDVQSYVRTWLAHAPAPRGDVRVSIDVDPQGFS